MTRTRVATILAGATAALPAHAASPAIELTAKGVQIYVCAAGDDAYAWKLKAPEALLFDAAGQAAGRHFAGPSWQAPDGSTVVGEPVAAGPAPRPDAVAWVVLRVKSHDGAGMFAPVAYITRTATSGGMAPASGCDAAHAGQEARIGYAATYTFFPG